MSKTFDPYHRWLAISPEKQPADHYRLLGCKPLEDDADVIESAADRQMAHVRGFQSGEHADDAQRLLNEIAAVKLVLLQPDEKAAYDAKLKAKRQQAKAKKKQERAIAKAQPLRPVAKAIPLPPSTPPPSFATPDESASAGTEAPASANTVAFQARSRKKAGAPNVAALAGAAAVVVLLMVGGVIAMVVKTWDTGAIIANNPNQFDPDDGNAAPADAFTPTVINAETDPQEQPYEDNGEFVAPPPAPVDPLPEDEQVAERELDVSAENDENHEEVASSADVATDEPKKSPIPDNAARDAARSNLLGIFKLEEAQSLSAKTRMSAQLIETARDTRDDPVSRFVMLNMARELAADAAQIRLVQLAIVQLESNYDFDATTVRLASLAAAIQSPAPIAQKREVVVAGIEMLDMLIAEDDYERVGHLADSLADLTKRMRDPQLLDALRHRQEYAQALRVAIEPVKPAFAKLAEDTNDENANTIAGRFLLFTKGDWRRALPMLAKGSDEDLARIAKAELANPQDPGNEKKLADAWWDFAAAQDDASIQRFSRARAGFWYFEAIGGLSGIDKVKANKRLGECQDDVRAMLPSQEAYLDDFRPAEVHVGHGNYATHGNDGDGGGKRRFGGEVPSHSIYTHAKSDGTVFAKYQLPKGFDRFEAIAGIWDHNHNDGRVAPLVFSVVGDNKVLWTSRPITKAGDGQPCRVNVKGIDTLALVVRCSGSHSFAHSAWIYPRILRVNPDVSPLVGDRGLRARHGANSTPDATPSLGIFSRDPSELQSLPELKLD